MLLVAATCATSPTAFAAFSTTDEHSALHPVSAYLLALGGLVVVAAPDKDVGEALFAVSNLAPAFLLLTVSAGTADELCNGVTAGVVEERERERCSTRCH